MNSDLRKKAKTDFEKGFFKLSIFGKTREYVRKHKDIKFVTAEKRRNYLVPDTFYCINRNTLYLQRHCRRC